MAPSTLTSLTRHLDQLRAQIDAGLLRAATFDDGCPPQLQAAIRDSLLSPGKRIRPILVLLAADACGSTNAEHALAAACAVEMVHAYSLIHDDLPAMDDDDLRRGRPTCHTVYGEAPAILAGDALLARSFEWLARHVRPPQRGMACCVALATAAGATQLVGGQADDLAQQVQRNEVEHTGNSEADLLAALESIHRRKTGALINAALQMGGLVADASQDELDALRGYGDRLGLAFQIVDDLLDASGRQSRLGKRVGKDASQGKLTFPLVCGVTGSRQRVQQLIDEACQALAPLSGETSHLEELARFVAQRDR